MAYMCRDGGGELVPAVYGEPLDVPEHPSFNFAVTLRAENEDGRCFWCVTELSSGFRCGDFGDTKEEAIEIALANLRSVDETNFAQRILMALEDPTCGITRDMKRARPVEAMAKKPRTKKVAQ